VLSAFRPIDYEWWFELVKYEDLVEDYSKKIDWYNVFRERNVRNPEVNHGREAKASIAHSGATAMA
jgi:hypothetical protein